MRNKIRLATVFSGIGAIEQTFLKLDIPYRIVFACDNGERILDQGYDEIEKEIKNKKIYGKDVNSFIKKNMKQLKKLIG
jgi:DNA (cytosine-5)-methyltransferase 1